MVNILLRIFDISSQKKKWKREKQISVDKKQEQDVKKVYVNIELSVHCVSTSPLKITTPLFVSNAPS